MTIRVNEGSLTFARRSAVAVAVGLMVASSAVYAQSTTNSTVYGVVAAKPGTTIQLENVATGAKRAVTPDAKGQFQAAALPPGTYRAQLIVDGKVTSTDTIELVAGQGFELKFGATTTAALQTVEVTGRRQVIDVSRSNSGATFTSKDIARLPVQENVAAVVQLAPATTRADFRYGNNAASFGGSGSSENAIYINGFTATNGMFQVGYSSLPFGAIASTNVITGGYGAEFGRSTGGVINITTKSGSNDWEVSVGGSWSPKALRAKQRDIRYGNTGAFPATDGKVFYYNGDDTADEKRVTASVSGPIIKDKLFFFLAAEQTEANYEMTRLPSNAVDAAKIGWLEQNRKTPRSFLKLDWNISDNHHLEYTGIRDTSKTKDRYFGFDYTTLKRNDVLGGGADFENYAAGVPFLSATGAAMSAPQGANLDIIKYTGYLTDDLTVQALAGKSKTQRVQNPLNYVPGLYPVTAAIDSRAPGVNYTPSQLQGFTNNLLRENAHDQNTGFRFDVEYRINDQHTVRAGIDSNHIKAVNGSQTAGGGSYTYLRTDTPNTPIAGMTVAPSSTGSALGALGYYVSENHFVNGATPEVKQAAQYIEDRYQATKNLQLAFGLRNEQFTNLNSIGETIIEKKRQLAPRFSASWDVNGDASMKVYGTAGRYHLQIPANLAVRFAGGSLNTQHFYTYTGVDPVTGAPLGKVSIGNDYSPNNEYGVPPDARVIAAKDIRSNTQDEFAIGFEKALSAEYVAGVRFNYRKLVSSIDDVSDTRPFKKYMSAAEYDYFSSNWGGSLFNPGQDNTFIVPVGETTVNGKTVQTMKEVAIKWSEWGFPEGLKRNYMALDFSLEHPMRNGWYGKVTYTLAKSTGNTEGQQKSDNGQADVGFTSVWDFPEIMINGSGPLPNMRRHQIKAMGVYELSDQFSVSGNALIASGRPRSCSATLPIDQDTAGLNSGYGSIFYVCKDAPGRGGLGFLPWETRLDLALMYKPNWLKGLTLKAEVFNVFDKQTVTAVNEAYNTAGGARSALYQMEQNYTAPRTVTFSAQYNHKF